MNTKKTMAEAELIRRIKMAKSKRARNAFIEGFVDGMQDVTAVRASAEELLKILKDHPLTLLSLSSTEKRAWRTRVQLPPGHHLTTWLRFVVPKKAFDRIFSQIILDYREEHFDALAEGSKWLARLRHGQMLIAIVLALILSAGTSAVKRVFDLWKAT